VKSSHSELVTCDEHRVTSSLAPTIIATVFGKIV